MCIIVDDLLRERYEPFLESGFDSTIAEFGRDDSTSVDTDEFSEFICSTVIWLLSRLNWYFSYELSTLCPTIMVVILALSISTACMSVSQLSFSILNTMFFS